ncbi:hypothetical protein PMZ80_011136 [Knufia obscura]|uniref:DUF7924 domain-containing protein n=1 Tax=Knufia obscura TaxID=1635080 RepID=A0ABR0R8S9_9EURO|nr:hypothetical protein PMZ80_011136 [Knufia obscura]
MSREPGSSAKKRPSSSSYTQSYKAGDAPKTHSAGLPYVQEESKSYCKRLLQSTYPEPQYTAFPLSKFLSVWQRVQNRNEARICRDLTPLLVPSPELLSICGQQELEHIVEDIDTEWVRCKTLGGPRPKPDLAIGIAASAFGEEELAKLQNHTAFERATLFTDNLYFPFLLCEAKSVDVGISSSMAVNAIVQLCRAADEAQVVDLSGRILAFSVSHDNERVKLYRHFVIIDGEKMAFYRYPIASFVSNFEEGQGRKRTHDLVREVYHTFYPAHMKRVHDALAAMEDPRNLSMTSSVDMEEAGSQELDPLLELFII